MLYCFRLMAGRRIVEKSTGDFLLGPASISEGDTICVVLGCDAPLILRPVPGSTPTEFQRVGESYVHGLDDGAPLLGVMPANWRLQLGDGRSPWVKNLRAGAEQDDDPRLPHLPEERKRIGDTWMDLRSHKWFQNVHTGEDTNYDPRMSAEALRDRGVKLQTFNLV